MRRDRRQERRQAVNSAAARAEERRAYEELDEEHEAMAEAQDLHCVATASADLNRIWPKSSPRTSDDDWPYDDEPPDPL